MVNIYYIKLTFVLWKYILMIYTYIYTYNFSFNCRALRLINKANTILKKLSIFHEILSWNCHPPKQLLTLLNVKFTTADNVIKREGNTLKTGCIKTIFFSSNGSSKLVQTDPVPRMYTVTAASPEICYNL